MHHTEPLCRQYDPYSLHSDIYAKYFLPDNIPVTIRPLVLPGDLDIISKWFATHYSSEKTGYGVELSKDYYITLLDSCNTQALLGTINGVPAFQADVYQALFAPEVLTDVCSLQPNDYVMQLWPSPEVMASATASVAAVLACLDCFFTYKEVNRVIWMTSMQEQYFRLMAAVADFEEMECDDPRQTYHIATREKFLPTLAQMPAVPYEPRTVLDY